jgi:dTDP-4-amino-4,6-dideoxygalactose transaminase
MPNEIPSAEGTAMTRKIPFTKPTLTGHEAEYVNQVIESGKLTGGGPFLQNCEAWLTEKTGAGRVLLTTSCTHALEISALLSGAGPGDEVIIPSFTFVSTANAFALRGATPVFVDNRPDTLNIDETKIEAAITPRTKAIVPVHYAGISCDMDAIMAIAEKHKLMVVEDSAQGLCSSYKGKALGTIGATGTFSFHETKNVVAGEGGALMINDPELVERAQNIREKGTNRRQFLLGQVDKYTWVDVGSAFLPSELMAAFLLAQLEGAETLTAQRLRLWDRYNEALAPLEAAERLRRPIVPEGCVHNAHIYYILLPDRAARDSVLGTLGEAGIGASFHFVPLESAPAGKKYARHHGSLKTTENTAGRLLRLPLYADLSEADQDYVVERLIEAVQTL